MKHSSYSHQPDERINELQLVTRSLLLLALLTGILYLRVFVIEIFSELYASEQRVLAFLSLLFLVAAIAGLLLTWRWEALGGLVSLVSGLGLAVMTLLSTADTPWLTTFFYSSPFIIAGGLSLICWHRSH